MLDKKKAIIVLSMVVCISLIALLCSIGYEKDMQKIKTAKDQETKIEDIYYEKARELGVENNVTLLKSLDRSFKKVIGQDRVTKLASGILSEFNYLINTQQLEKAYSMLDDGYKEDFGITYEIFSARYSGEKIDKYVISSIENMSLGGIISVKYFILTENGYIKKNISIMETKEGKYALTLNGLTERTTMMKEHAAEGIKVDVVERYKVGDNVAYKMIIENTSSIDIEIKNVPNGFYGVNQGQKYSHTLLNSITPYFIDNYIVRQGEKKEFIIEFNSLYYLEKIGFELENGKIVEVNLAEI